MKRFLAAGVLLVGGLWVAAHHPEYAGWGFAAAILSYFVAPGRKRSKGHN